MADLLGVVAGAALVFAGSNLLAWLIGRGASRMDHPSDDRKGGRRG